MPVPTHAVTCKTRVWSTLCHFCRAQVFFLSCSCGSKVYLDAPCPPWPAHSCVQYRISHLRSVGRMPAAAVRRLVEDEAARLGTPVPPEAIRALDEATYRETGRHTIVPVYPADDAVVEVDGRVETIGRQAANFFKRFRYPDNRMGRALLGELVRQGFLELTVVGDPDPLNGFCDRFECFVPNSVLGFKPVEPGDRLSVRLRPHFLADGVRMWLVEEARHCKSTRA